MRIVGGRHRGRRLLAPPGDTVRPTSDRAREALFNILSHGRLAAGGVPFAGAAVLDAFAGTGALGLEALSRGAAEAVFVERDPEAVAVLRRNVAALGESDRAEIVPGDAARPPRLSTPLTKAVSPPRRSKPSIAPTGSRRMRSRSSSSARASNWRCQPGLLSLTSASTAPRGSSSCATRTVGDSGSDFSVSTGKNPVTIDPARQTD